MAWNVSCPECEKRYRVGEDKAGRKFRCRDCGTTIRVPESDDVPGECRSRMMCLARMMSLPTSPTGSTTSVRISPCHHRGARGTQAHLLQLGL